MLPQSYSYPNYKHWFTTSFIGGSCRKVMLGVKLQTLVYHKLKALVYHLLPWRKLPRESDALSVARSQTPSTGLRHPSFNGVRSVARSVIRTQTFRRALTASMDSCAEINGVPLQWRNQFWQSLEEGTVPRRRKSLTPSILPLITP